MGDDGAVIIKTNVPNDFFKTEILRVDINFTVCV